MPSAIAPFTALLCWTLMASLATASPSGVGVDDGAQISPSDGIPGRGVIEDLPGDVLRRQLEQILRETPAAPMDFPEGCTLADFLEVLNQHLLHRVGRRIPLVVDEPQLQYDGIDSTDDVEVKPLAIESHSTLPLHRQIDVTLMQTDGPELILLPAEGFLMLTTRDRADELLFSRAYSVMDLVTKVPLPAESGERQKELSGRLYSLLMGVQRHAPESLWMDIDGEGGSIDIIGNKLVVSQTAQTHRQIRRYFQALRNPVPLVPEIDVARHSQAAFMAKDVLPKETGGSSSVSFTMALILFASTGWVLAAVLGTICIMRQMKRSAISQDASPLAPSFAKSSK